MRAVGNGCIQLRQPVEVMEHAVYFECLDTDPGQLKPVDVKLANSTMPGSYLRPYSTPSSCSMSCVASTRRQGGRLVKSAAYPGDTEGSSASSTELR